MPRLPRLLTLCSLLLAAAAAGGAGRQLAQANGSSSGTLAGQAGEGRAWRHGGRPQGQPGAGGGSKAQPSAARPVSLHFSPHGPSMPHSGASPPHAWGILMWEQAQLAASADGSFHFIAANATLLPGLLVRPAADNLQPSLEACAASCRAAPNCSAFNYCGAAAAAADGGRCLVEPSGSLPLPPRGCELRLQQTVMDGNSVTLLATGGLATVAGVHRRRLLHAACHAGQQEAPARRRRPCSHLLPCRTQARRSRRPTPACPASAACRGWACSASTRCRRARAP